MFAGGDGVVSRRQRVGAPCVRDAHGFQLGLSTLPVAAFTLVGDACERHFFDRDHAAQTLSVPHVPFWGYGTLTCWYFVCV